MNNRYEQCSQTFFIKISLEVFEKTLVISEKVCYNNQVIWRVVRAGRRSTIGNRVNGYNRFEGSNPSLSARKTALLLKRNQ